MAYIRIIPRLDIKGPNLVKGIHLEGLRVLGKPEVFAAHYYENGADELLFQDVVASLYERNSLHDIVSRVAEKIFIPLTVGGLPLPPLLAQRGHLSEVFVNILTNAREAMGGKGWIKVSAQYGGDFNVIVKIADNGPGIPPEKLAKIFEPYFTTKDRGTGLGLAIVKHNTELYNGSVQVESEIGKGTVFTILLPAKTIINIKR